jgi:predicted amidohydrolase
MVRVALIQARTGTDPVANLEALAQTVAQAAGGGARLVLTPEGSNLLQRDRAALLQVLRDEDSDPMVAAAPALARQHGVALVLGSVLVRRPDGTLANRLMAFDADGTLVARYDKIHLFDVDLGPGAEHRESGTYTPGAQAVVAGLAGVQVGLSICYDLRFAHLYRALSQAGAQVLVVPSAFTVPTGQAHWEVLLRARAIENGAWVLAAAQGGIHADGRATWGRSMVVSPWGEVTAALPDDAPGVLFADIDPAASTEARRRIPALRHDRPFELGRVHALPPG